MADSTPASGTQDTRRPELDWIKAVAIITVVLIHCLPPFFAARVTPAELWLGAITRFAVPGFLLASGFLYASAGSRNWPVTLGRRLKRLLIPYVLFSIVAHFYPVQPSEGRSLIEKLLTGAALGEYYYIFVIFWMMLAAPLIAQIPRSVFPFVLLLSLLLQWGFETASLLSMSPFWSIRNPVRWIATFLMGWWIFENRVGIQRAISAHRAAWIGGFATAWTALAVCIAVVSPGLLRNSLVWIEIYASLGLLFAATVGTRRVPWGVRWLSDVSYSIYLSHLFFVDPVLRAIPRVPGIFSPLRLGAAWIAGLGGGAMVSALARLLLGERRARLWLG